MEYYEKNGQIAVLVSHGFGAGWSTWNTKELAYDKRVVEFWLSRKDDQKFMKAISSFGDNNIKKETVELFATMGYSHVYFGGFRDIEIEWVNKGKPFVIQEYDGSETIVTIDNAGFITLG